MNAKSKKSTNTKMLLMVSALSLLSAAAKPSIAAEPTTDAAQTVERGRYLVAIGGCTDCHTPMKMGAKGPEPDLDFYLAGHPADLQLPPAPQLPEGPWVATVAASMTAWSGPWGVSFTANLTPDVETGLGAWTAQDFVAMVRTGRHMGKGRPILPPMPVPSLAAMTDEDLLAVFAYLRSLPAVHNPVPAPIAPNNGRS